MNYRSVAISIGDDVVVKTQDPGLAYLEMKKAKNAHILSTKSSLFYSPSILDYDENNGTIYFERLIGYESINNLKDSRDLSDDVFGLVGSALQFIHKAYHLPDSLREPIPRVAGAVATKDVFIHGDFSLVNLLYNQELRKLAIIDWSLADWMASSGTIGPPYFDLGLVLINVFWRKPFSGADRDNIAQRRALTLVNSYRNDLASDVQFSTEEFAYYVDCLGRVYFHNLLRKQHGLRAYLFKGVLNRVKRFLNHI